MHGVRAHYFFIRPDIPEHNNVMCLPSVSDIGYKPYEHQRVLFRAGPSEKAASRYLQAIRVTVQDLIDVEPMNLGYGAVADTVRSAVLLSSRVDAVAGVEREDRRIAEDAVADRTDAPGEGMVPPWRRYMRQRVL